MYRPFVFNYKKFYDDTVELLMKQGCKAVGKKINDLGVSFDCCLYRAGNLKCAIGMHIPDNMYVVEMEKGGAIYLCNNYPEFVQHLVGKYGDGGTLTDLEKLADFLAAVQSLHDHKFFSFIERPQYFWRELKIKFGLRG